MWEAGAPLQPREPAQAASAGQEERLHTDHAAPARLARRHTESSTSSSGTREPGVNILLPPYADCFLGASITDSSHKGWRGNLQGLTTGNLMVMEKQGEAYSNKHMDLDRLSSYLKHPSSSPNQWLCSSVEPRWWCSLTREWFCLMQVFKEPSCSVTWHSPTQA